MRDSIVIAQFEKRLVQMGCPLSRVRANVQELAEHYEDLKQAAMEEGLSEKEAEARASEQLGNPILLAENAVALLQQSSWWGRHPIVGFCVLPLPVFVLAWALCTAMLGALCWLLGKIFGPAYTLDYSTLNTLRDNPKVFNTITFAMNVALCLFAIQIVVVVFCRLANRAASGLKWMLAACVSCAFISLINASEIRPRTVTFTLGWPPQHWFYAMPPLVTAAVLLIYEWLKQSRFPLVPIRRHSKGTLPTAQKIRWFATPTFWITTVLSLSFFALAFKPVAYAFNEAFRKQEIQSKVWPVERADTLAYLKLRQSVTPPAGEETINLKPYLNAGLSEPIDGPGDAKDDNLAELPAGIHTFGSVSFDVEGRVQLVGNALINTNREFPTRVNIPISHSCSRFYLLHGAIDLDAPGNEVAWMILHYNNGSNAKIDIVGGKEVLDCWGPIYNTDSGDDRYTTSPETELAWAGSNPDIKKESPEFSLRLYKSTFTNPHPELEISSIDYVSSLSGASPFLVGLTIEKP